MKNKKLSLKDLKVESFVTELSEKFDGKTVVGGRKMDTRYRGCPPKYKPSEAYTCPKK